jgi:putative oxidoreductase
MNTEKRLPLALLLLRLSVFVVMFVWTIDKFIEPQHASKIMAAFYSISGVGDVLIYLFGAIELAIILAFVLGFAKRWSYRLVLLLHAISTLASYQKYLNPFQSPNLLFFAALPMLTACFVLYYLRDADVLWTIEKPASPANV